MKKINHNELNELLKHYYDRKLPLFVWGRFGIGKSQVVRESSKEIAEKRGRKFVEWNKLTEKEKQDVFEYCEKYFVLIDIRLSEYDSSDIKGLPIFTDNKRAIEFKIPFWALLLEKDNSDGVLFFDEINLAVPLVLSSCYKIIYDRVVNTSKINDNWLILGCGNLSEDRAYTHEIASPLRDRGGEVELVGSDVDSWVGWAIKNNIDSRIIGFLNFKTSNIYKVDFNDNQKFTTHRGWARVSTLVTGVEDYDKIDLITSSAISEGIAKEFVAFCKIKDTLKIEEIIKNPEKLKSVTEISVKYFLITALADRYKNDKIKFEQIYKISQVLDEIKNAEFVALLWRICYGYNQKFKNDFVKIVDNKFADKYAKYIC